MSPDFRTERPVFAVLAEGRFGLEGAKTAASTIRYLPDRVAAVIDSETAGATAADVLGFGDGIPVVDGLERALEVSPRPEALLIGVAPQGGKLPPEWRSLLRAAIEAGLDVWSGLHHQLARDAELSELAGRHDVRIRDLRAPPDDLSVGTGKAAGTTAHRLLTVGTDCNVGKMTTTLELRRALAGRGVDAAFAATGQTGILIEGWGIAVDAVVSDFVAGAAEALVLEAAAEPGAPPRASASGAMEPAAAAGGPDGDPAGGAGGLSGPDVVLVEGQGSLLHPGYSGVTLGLLHGAMPQSMVLCWMPGRDTIYSGQYDWVTIPPIEEVVRIYEEAASWIRPPVASRVVGISACTYDLDEAEARRHVERARERTGLPVTDPIRFGPDPLADAVEAALEG